MITLVIIKEKHNTEIDKNNEIIFPRESGNCNQTPRPLEYMLCCHNLQHTEKSNSSFHFRFSSQFIIDEFFKIIFGVSEISVSAKITQYILF